MVTTYHIYVYNELSLRLERMVARDYRPCCSEGDMDEYGFCW